MVGLYKGKVMNNYINNGFFNGTKKFKNKIEITQCIIAILKARCLEFWSGLKFHFNWIICVQCQIQDEAHILGPCDRLQFETR